ncbi:MAG: hypothetical protein L0312_08885, partial [Acidobacteria bacterium]|nr:hypothetical protein [Acidobacteriota bacterium]
NRKAVRKTGKNVQSPTLPVGETGAENEIDFSFFTAPIAKGDKESVLARENVETPVADKNVSPRKQLSAARWPISEFGLNAGRHARSWGLLPIGYLSA